MEWIKVEDRLPDDHCICMVKRKNGNIVKSYFHSDKMNWLNRYSRKNTHFQDCETLKFLFDVIEWKER